MKFDSRSLQTFLQIQQYLYRCVKISETAQQPYMVIDNKRVLSFCSNDYLGLANHPTVIKSFQQAANQYGVGSGASHLINGHSKAHHQLEEKLAEFTGRERALLFSTGYMANLGVVNALMQRGDKIFADRLNHASLVDAAILSRAKCIRYPHNDMNFLAKKLQQFSTTQNKLILTDGVFSMEGDVAPLKQMSQLACQYEANLMVDDAHGFGVLGKTGAGLLQQENLQPQAVAILMATLGKAVGTAGAFVAASNDLIEYLIQTARTWIYTTAMPAAIAVATLKSLEIIVTETWRREKLKHLIQVFRQGAMELGLNLMPSDTAIQPLLLGNSAKALKYSNKLWQNGILVTAIRPPTVPKGGARLRITLSASHETHDVKKLLDCLSCKI